MYDFDSVGGGTLLERRSLGVPIHSLHTYFGIQSGLGSICESACVAGLGLNQIGEAFRTLGWVWLELLEQNWNPPCPHLHSLFLAPFSISNCLYLDP